MSHESNTPRDDEELDLAELLRPLQAVEPTAETRLAIREAVAAGSVRTSSGPSREADRWWRRSIAVPMPVAAACALLLAALIWQMFRNAGASPTTELARAPQPSVDAGQPGTVQTSTDPVSIAAPPQELREAQVYVCGLGRLSSHSTLLIRD